MKTKKFLLSVGVLVSILLCACTIVYFTHDCEKHIEWNDAIAVDFDSGESKSSDICRICNKSMTFTHKIETQDNTETHDCSENVDWLDEIMRDPETEETHSAGYCRICDKYLSFIDGELQNE